MSERDRYNSDAAYRSATALRQAMALVAAQSGNTGLLLLRHSADEQVEGILADIKDLADQFDEAGESYDPDFAEVEFDRPLVL